jgi:hypothetical protein
MKIHISTLALFFWGFIILFAGLSNDFLMTCLAMVGLCFALYWHIWHLKSEKEFEEDPIDVMQTYYLRDGTKIRAVPEKDFHIISKSLFATLEQVEKLQKEKASSIAKWFKKGQNSAKRKNKSGCCCIINDDDEIVSMCGAHEDHVEELKSLMREVSSADWFIRYNDEFNERWKKALES